MRRPCHSCRHVAESAGTDETALHTTSGTPLPQQVPPSVALPHTTEAASIGHECIGSTTEEHRRHKPHQQAHAGGQCSPHRAPCILIDQSARSCRYISNTRGATSYDKRRQCNSG